MTEPEKEKSGNQSGNVLSILASSGDNWVKLATIGLIALSGGGNFLATTKSSEFNATEINRAVNEIHHLHDELNASIERQKQIYEFVKELKKP